MSHGREGAVPSGLAHEPFLPGTPVPGYRLFRPCGTRFRCSVYPGLCRLQTNRQSGQRNNIPWTLRAVDPFNLVDNFFFPVYFAL